MYKDTFYMYIYIHAYKGVRLLRYLEVVAGLSGGLFGLLHQPLLLLRVLLPYSSYIRIYSVLHDSG